MSPQGPTDQQLAFQAAESNQIRRSASQHSVSQPRANANSINLHQLFRLKSVSFMSIGLLMSSQAWKRHAASAGRPEAWPAD